MTLAALAVSASTPTLPNGIVRAIASNAAQAA